MDPLYIDATGTAIPRPGLVINGERVLTAAPVPVFDPADGQPFAEVHMAGEAECSAAVDAAAGAAEEWAATSPRERSEILRRTFEAMIDQHEALARLITRENGKSLADARAEVSYAAEFFRWFAEEAVRIAGEFRVAPAGDKRIIVTQHPIGPSLLVTPWNFPAAMATRKWAPALAAGCTTVLKPASETPLTALALAEILHSAGVPAGVVNVIPASPAGSRVREMLHDTRIKNLSFTGSTEVGVSLLREAADHVLRTSMELGGNAPFLVLGDADLDAAVEGALVAKLRNGGAACTAANRFYVHASVAPEFTARLSAAMERLHVGPGLDQGNDIGALVSRTERDKVAALVDMASAAGARIITGGQVPEGPGAFYPPTVLAGLAPDSELLRNEIFGPVAPIVSFDTVDDAVRMANDTPYGLISYVYGGAFDATFAIAERLESGMVAINRGALSDPAAPFGGVKESGIGREGGFAGIHEFLESTYIAASL
ncbi:NAD-dependent succinate-semialdehyde dehydrogenase [Nocardioides sp. LMS-CY]|uniref:NAD-dependent succinate-semialdehyde dehydrogenase n=1 Tax=Nocardioides sp. (strain LMS-CY) TaxID=2840457 RepID=UPI001BFFFC76|nr:NAD-dependent succinate-semialdehyde dehydrogenase [Nocardioides sp. LMS-CY]QWF20474.1 NAD-dependent succinate-semialdehyde dehydrogenase [Nocardioides sp. LMS-CY]